VAILCDMCRRRRAVYKRTYSGHNLCPACLEKMLARSVKRVIGESSLLDPGSTITSIVRPSSPSISLAGLLLLSRVESKFNVKLKIIIPKTLVESNPIKHAIEKISKRIETYIIEESFPIRETRNLIACVRLERAWALKHSKNHNSNALLFPLDRTTSNLLGIDALLSGNREGLSEVLPFLTWTQPPTINFLYRIESEALTALAYVEGLYMDPYCYPPLPSKIPFTAIMGSRPELEFSSYKTLKRIAEESIPRLRKCMICGGFAESGDVCSYCRELGGPGFLKKRL